MPGHHDSPDRPKQGHGERRGPRQRGREQRVREMRRAQRETDRLTVGGGRQRLRASENEPEGQRGRSPEVMQGLQPRVPDRRPCAVLPGPTGHRKQCSGLPQGYGCCHRAAGQAGRAL